MTESALSRSVCARAALIKCRSRPERDRFEVRFDFRSRDGDFELGHFSPRFVVPCPTAARKPRQSQPSCGSMVRAVGKLSVIGTTVKTVGGIECAMDADALIERNRALVALAE